MNFKKTVTSLLDIEDDFLFYTVKGLLQEIGGSSFFYFFLLFFFFFLYFYFLEGTYFVGVNRTDSDSEISVVLRPNSNSGNEITINGNKASWSKEYSVTVDKEITEGIYKMFLTSFFIGFILLFCLVIFIQQKHHPVVIGPVCCYISYFLLL
jgi:hypothetical protein